MADDETDTEHPTDDLDRVEHPRDPVNASRPDQRSPEFARHEKDGDFPEFEEEYKTVQQINKQMMKARDEWEPPEQPTYDEESSSVHCTGTVRSIRLTPEDQRSSSRLSPSSDTDKLDSYDFTMMEEHKIEFGLDMGESDLTWVSVTNTGEWTMKNPYVRLCNMYDVHPEYIQEFFTEDVEVKQGPITKIFVGPANQPFKSLWNRLYMPHFRHHLVKLKPKDIGPGYVPTWRFFPAYLAALFVFILYRNSLNTLAAGGTAEALAAMLLGVPLVFGGLAWGFLCTWGVYAKARYDIFPYIVDWLEYKWEIRQHRKA